MIRKPFSEELWAVVNNAGIGCYGEIEMMNLDVYERINQVNTVGTLRVTKTMLPFIRKSQGRIVIVASLAGIFYFIKYEFLVEFVI